VRIVRVLNREEHFQPSVLCFRRIQGITCRELALRLQDAARQAPEHAAPLEELLGTLGFQALHALAEFRRFAGETARIRSHLKKYPWSQKLGSAITECGRFVTRDRKIVSNSVSDAELLGRELLKGSFTPFRDATLKNRIVKCEENSLVPSTIHSWTSSTDPTHSFRWLRENTFDIDFESGLDSVNEWDDVLHVLCDPALWLLDFSQGSLGLPDVFRRWWHTPETEEAFDLIWKTLLAETPLEPSSKHRYKGSRNTTRTCLFFKKSASA